MYGEADGFHYECVLLSDGDDVIETSPMVGTFIRQSLPHLRDAWRRGEGVLVHCNSGMNRSASVVCALLMIELHMSFRDAFRLILSARPICFPVYWRYLVSREFASLVEELRVCDDRIVLSADDVVQITNLIHSAMHYLDTGELERKKGKKKKGKGERGDGQNL